MKFKYSLIRPFSSELSDFECIMSMLCLAFLFVVSLVFFLALIPATYGLILFIYIPLTIYYLFKQKVFYFEKDDEE